MAKRILELDPSAGSFDRLIHEMEKLPGIGRRSAERMAYHLLAASKEEAMALAIAIRDVKSKLKPCAICGDLTENEQCRICSDTRREHDSICVVEWPRDIRAIEKCSVYKGTFHVLMGRLSPLSGVEIGDLRISQLLQRLRKGAIKEVILATSPSAEGDATARYLAQQIQATNPTIRTSRLARGLPAGSELSFAQSGTVGDAFRGRTELR